MEAQLSGKSTFKKALGILSTTTILICIFIIIGLNTFPLVLSILSFTLLLYILLCSVRYFFSLVAIKNISPKISHLDQEPPFISVIVPAYNEGLVLKRTIPAMLKSRYPKDRIEFLYVYEKKSTDDTEDIILSYAKKDERIRPLLRVSDKGGKAAATNYGIRHAKGEIIASFDADHSVSSDAILRAVEWFQDPNVMCVKGRCRGINKNDNFLAMISGIERDIMERLCIPSSFILGGFSTFGGGHAYFRKSIFKDIGLFDEEVLTEDIDYSVRLHIHGYQVVCDPLIISWEELPARFDAWYHQRERWARGWMQVWRRHYPNILHCKNMKHYEKFDTILSLTITLGVVISIFLIPTMLLNMLGSLPLVAPSMIYTSIVYFGTFVPIFLAILVVYVDYKEEGIIRLREIAFSFLIIPYFFLLVEITWLAFVEEFVFRSESVYMKTLRNDTLYTKADSLSQKLPVKKPQ